MIEEKDNPPSGVLSPTTGLEEPVQAAISANFLAEYEPCLTCKDLGRNCKGPKLAALGTISNVREYHRRLRSSHKITMKQVFQLTEHEISNATVKDYFSHEAKDFRWATVSLIDNALTVICGDCVGLPPAYLPNCPATSSEIREQMEKVNNQLKISEETNITLIEQINEIRKDHQERTEWLKADVKLWRKISFSLLGALVLVVISFLIYVMVNISAKM